MANSALRKSRFCIEIDEADDPPKRASEVEWRTLRERHPDLTRVLERHSADEITVLSRRHASVIKVVRL